MACPSWMPFGTVARVYADDGSVFGDFTCHDRFSASLSDRLDLFLPTVQACYAETGYHAVTVVGQ